MAKMLVIRRCFNPDPDRAAAALARLLVSRWAPPARQTDPDGEAKHVEVAKS